MTTQASWLAQVGDGVLIGQRACWLMTLARESIDNPRAKSDRLQACADKWQLAATVINHLRFDLRLYGLNGSACSFFSRTSQTCVLVMQDKSQCFRCLIRCLGVFFEPLATILVVRVTRHINVVLEVVDLEKCQIYHPYCGQKYGYRNCKFRLSNTGSCPKSIGNDFGIILRFRTRREVTITFKVLSNKTNQSINWNATLKLTHKNASISIISHLTFSFIQHCTYVLNLIVEEENVFFNILWWLPPVQGLGGGGEI